MKEADLKAIGARIQDLRKLQGYTQEQLAERMHVSIQMVSNLERGNKAIRIENLIRLSRILDISTDYILTGEEPRGASQALSDRIARLPERQRKLVELLVDCCLDGDP